MLSVAVTFLAPLAQTVLEEQLKSFIHSKVEEEAIRSVYEKVYVQMDKVIQGIVTRTKIYLAMTGFAMTVIIAKSFVSVPQWVNIMAFVGILGVSIFMTYQFIMNLKRAMDVASNYEELLKAEIDAEFERVKVESFRKKAALWYSGANSENYYHFVLSNIVKAFFSWLRAHKSHLYIRMACYFLTAFALSYTWRVL